MKIKGTMALSDALSDKKREAHAAHGGCCSGGLRLDLSGNYIVEEIFNSITHGVGLLLSIIGGYFLLQVASTKSWVHIISTSIFIVSLILMFCEPLFFFFFFPF